MKKQPLQPSSILLYQKIGNSALERLGTNPSIEALNEFVHQKRQNAVRSAVKWLLLYLGRGDDFGKVVRIRQKEPTRSRNYLTKEKAEDVSTHITGRFRAVFLIQFYTCSRATEILGIRAGDIEDIPDCLRIRIVGKGGRLRNIYIYRDEVIEYLLKLKDKAKSPKSFLFIDGDVHKMDDLFQRTKIQSVYKRYEESLQKASEAAGYGVLRSHDLRRSFADWGVDKDPQKAQHAGGWKDASMFQRYTDKKREDRDAAEMMKMMQLGR